MKKKCEFCGEEFEKKRKNSKYCSTKCYRMGRKLTKEEQLKRANKTHNFFYNYDKFDFSKGVRDKSIITCPIHGDFMQNMSEHMVGSGCAKCGRTRITLSRKLSKEEQLKRANKFHNNKYDYDKFDFSKGINHKSIITCPIHGDFEQKMNKHMIGRGCPKCGINKRAKNRRKNLDFYMNRLKNKYGDKIDFSNSVYKGYHEDIEYLCVKHNTISRRRFNRLLNNDESLCPKCSTIKRPIYNSYVYIIRLFNEKENFIKIGITHSISKRRFNEIRIGTDFSYEILSFRFHKETLKKEQELHEKMKEFSYIPEQKLKSGNTECFTLESFEYLKDVYKINVHKNIKG
jgi:hypothetical protein